MLMITELLLLSPAVYRRIITIILIASIAEGQLQLNDLKQKFSLTTSASLLPGLLETGEPCTCAVFMSGQFKKGSNEQPTGYPALVQETDIHYPCTASGTKLCVNKCLETIVKHLPNSPAIICGTIDRDCHRERAYLFVKNCDAKSWINSNLSAGREYCCKTGSPVSCLERLT